MLNDSKVMANIPASDLGRARSFYADKLGLTPPRSCPATVLVYRTAGGTDFQMLPDRLRRPGRAHHRPVPRRRHRVEVHDLTRPRASPFETYDLPGVRWDGEIASMEGMGRAAWFKDSEGNTMCLDQPRLTARPASAPDLLGGLDDQRQLGDLLVAGERVALDRRGEPALARQRQLLERHEPRRLVDPALEVVLALQLRALRRHQARGRPACPAARTAAARTRRTGRRRTRGRSRRPPGRRTAPRRRSRSRPRPPRTSGSCPGTCGW